MGQEMTAVWAHDNLSAEINILTEKKSPRVKSIKNIQMEHWVKGCLMNLYLQIRICCLKLRAGHAASPVVFVHTDAFSSRDELLDFCHPIVLPCDLRCEHNRISDWRGVTLSLDTVGCRAAGPLSIIQDPS